MTRLHTLSKQISAVIAGRRLPIVAIVLFILVTVATVWLPELTTIYRLALLVSSVFVITAGYHRRSVAWSLFLGLAPVLGELTAHLIREAFIAPTSITVTSILQLYARSPYAALLVGVLYILGRTIARTDSIYRSDSSQSASYRR